MTEQALNLDNLIRKAQALTALAQDPRTPPNEAASAQRKADAILFKYKIDLLTAPVQAGIIQPVPVWKTLWVCRTGSEWLNYYYSLASSIVWKNDIRYNQKYETNPDDGYRWLVLEAAGYESDLRYAEMLIATASSVFARYLEPQHDPAESEAANALRLRRGGMERRRISMVLFGGWATENEMKAKNRKVTSLIKAEAKRIGEPELAHELLGRTNNIKTYRVSYANGFYDTLNSRLRTKQLMDQSEATALVLAGAKDAVDELFYERYPSLRPKAVLEGSSASTLDECRKCAAAKSGYCREHGWLRPRAARETPYSSAGVRAGRSAARSVDLGGHGGSLPASAAKELH